MVHLSGVLTWGHTAQLSQSLQILKKQGVNTYQLLSADFCMVTERLGITHLSPGPDEGSQTSGFVKPAKAN